MLSTHRSGTFLLATFALFLGASAAIAANPAEPRKPVGLYLHFVVDQALKQHRDIKSELTGLLKSDLLKDVIQGVTVGERWSTIEKSAPTECGASLADCTRYSGFDWSALDDVFDVVRTMPGKTVQLIITPGMDAPQWVKDELAPCDGLFVRANPPPPPEPNPGPNPYALPKPDKDCGSAAFIDFPEQKRAGKDRNGDYALPLPWNSKYQEAWWYFLRALNDHFKGDPRLVAVAVAGPIAASDEFILPTSLNGSRTKIGNYPADEAWSMLIRNAFPDKPADFATSNQVFIDAWQRTIEKYQSYFSGLTLFIGPDAANDLPTYGRTTADVHKEDGAIDLFNINCSKAVRGQKNYTVSCEAKTQIIALFLDSKGPNQKATQVGGMKATSSTDTGNIGVAGVKLLTAPNPPHWSSPLAIGGAEFDHALSHPKDHEGCLPQQPNCMLDAEEAAGNVLRVFFDQTSFGPDYNGSSGDRTMYYLDVSLDDVKYMEKYGCSTRSGKGTPLVQQLAKANHDMFEMAKEVPPPSIDCSSARSSDGNQGNTRAKSRKAGSENSDEKPRLGRHKKG